MVGTTGTPGQNSAEVFSIVASSSSCAHVVDMLASPEWR
jgi:hypothetical protein